jgi:hypothetical protein
MVRRHWLTAVVLGIGGTPCVARAQMVGVPVLQNAFLNPGITAGANFATGDHANTYGVAAAWVPANAVLQVSGGVALFDPDSTSAHLTWGLRLMVPIPWIGTPQLGVAAFAGVGGLSVHQATETRIPVGVSVGYRRALGATHGISAYVSPFYSVSRFKPDSGSVTHGLFRVSVGVDVVVMPGLGVTVGFEGGSRARRGEPGPAGGLFGVGLSYALRRSP